MTDVTAANCLQRKGANSLKNSREAADDLTG